MLDNGLCAIDGHAQADAHHFIGGLAKRGLNRFAGHCAQQCRGEQRVFHHPDMIGFVDLARRHRVTLIAHRNGIGHGADGAANGEFGILLQRADHVDGRSELERAPAYEGKCRSTNEVFVMGSEVAPWPNMGVAKGEDAFAEPKCDCADGGLIHVARNQLHADRDAPGASARV